MIQPNMLTNAEQIVKELKDSLIDKPLQWKVEIYGEGVTVRFNQEIKDVSADTLITSDIEGITFKFKGAGAKNKWVSIDTPVSLQKIDNDNVLMYHLIASSGRNVITLGYLKQKKCVGM
jgi:hypothetical protein